MDKNMQAWWDSSQFSGGNAAYLEELYEKYLYDAHSVPQQWQQYFQDLPTANSTGNKDVAHSVIREYFRELSSKPKLSVVEGGKAATDDKQFAVWNLINTYRGRGHKLANIDPLGIRIKEEAPELELKAF